jgi:hypothetical protein
MALSAAELLADRFGDAVRQFDVAVEDYRSGAEVDFVAVGCRLQAFADQLEALTRGLRTPEARTAVAAAARFAAALANAATALKVDDRALFLARWDAALSIVEKV